MEGGDRWGMLKCAGGVQDKTIINRPTLRFRPIAPKPVTGDSVSGESMFSTESLVFTGKRAKRKYVRVCKENNRKRRILNEAKEDNNGKKSFVTLQLMPEKADLEKTAVGERTWGGVVDDLDPTVGDCYLFKDPPSRAADDATAMGLPDQTAVIASPRKRVRVVELWLTVQSVTESCMDEGDQMMRKYTDVEKMKNLEKDTCPGFISDDLNRVFWVNQAFKNMVGVEDGHGEGAAETALGLVVTDGFIFPYGAFSCRVGFNYGGAKGNKYSKMVVPCDVWKMSFGGFAWRLDVKAALSL